MLDQKYKILIVDDQKTNVLLLDGILQPEGFDTIHAFSGPEALEKVAAEKPDLVLLDLLMPGMNGMEVCKRIRKTHPDEVLPIIMVTALSEREEKLRSLSIGADDFLSKPIDHAELLARVGSLLRLRNLALNLRKERDRLAASENARASLEQMVVHDLKTPLGIIRNCHELIRTMGSKPRYLAMAERACDEMLSMITNIIEIGALEEGNLTVRLVLLDLGEFLKKRREIFETTCMSRKVNFILKYPDNMDKIKVDPHLLSRILDNLISNAVKHAEEESTVTLEIEKMPNQATRISVADQGEGIPEEYRERIFDKYMQIQARREGNPKDFGLGLAFCKLAIEAHGGKIWVENNPGGGSRFVFDLPATV